MSMVNYGVSKHNGGSQESSFAHWLLIKKKCGDNDHSQLPKEGIVLKMFCAHCAH